MRYYQELHNHEFGSDDFWRNVEYYAGPLPVSRSYIVDIRVSDFLFMGQNIVLPPHTEPPPCSQVWQIVGASMHSKVCNGLSSDDMARVTAEATKEFPDSDDPLMDYLESVALVKARLTQVNQMMSGTTATFSMTRLIFDMSKEGGDRSLDFFGMCDAMMLCKNYSLPANGILDSICSINETTRVALILYKMGALVFDERDYYYSGQDVIILRNDLGWASWHMYQALRKNEEDNDE